MKFIKFFSLIFLFAKFSFAQNFTNSDLDGSCIGSSQLPTGWQNVPETDVNCLANIAGQATPDVTCLSGPTPITGVNGNPYSGTTFVSGLMMGPGSVNIWHEGIMQTVSGFSIGCEYQVNFFQAVVKQSSALDTSGSWAVYLDNSLIGTTSPTTSQEPFNSNSFIWEFRTLSFIASSTTHNVKFLPMDDDTDHSSVGLNGGLRMGIDSIFITSALLSPQPVSVLGNDTSICPGVSFTLNLNYPGASFLWHDGSMDSSFVVTQAGIYWVEITTGCGIFFDTLHVDFIPPITFSFGNDTSLCSGQSLVLNPSIVNVYYLWQDGSNASTFTVTQPGTYWVKISDSCGLTSDTINVNYLSTPSVHLGTDTILCNNQTFVLNTGILNATNLWQDNSTGASYLVMQAGTYWVQITDSCGSTSDTIQVNYVSTPSIHLGNDTVLCSNQLIVLNAGTPNVTYLWQDNSTMPTYIVTQAGTYWVQLTDSCGISSDTIQVDNLTEPVFSLGEDTTLCSGQQITLNVNLSNANYVWHDNSTSPNFTVNIEGLYWVEASNPCGVFSDTIRVNYYQSTPVYLGADTSFCEGQSMLLNATKSDGIYLWHDHSTQATYMVKENGDYWVQVSDSCGITSDTITVKVKSCTCKLFVPNAFTPNGDMKNDEFLPISNCELNEYSLLIYNRWGERLFSGSHSQIGWDGTYKGVPAPIGTYFYLINYRFENHEGAVLKGDITLLR